MTEEVEKPVEGEDKKVVTPEDQVDQGETQEESGDSQEEETVEETPTDEEEKPDLDTDVWGDTKSEVGNDVLRVLQDSGVTPEQAKSLMWDAVQNGDVAQIDVDELTKVLGSKHQANIVITGVKGFIQEQTAKAQEVMNTLYEEVGSKDNWDTLVEWAKKELPPEDIQDYITMVDAGGRKAKLAAKDLKERYEESGNTSLSADKTVVPKSGGKTTTRVEPLSRAQYFEAMEKSQREGKLTEARKKQLWNQREAGRKQGM